MSSKNTEDDRVKELDGLYISTLDLIELPTKTLFEHVRLDNPALSEEERVNLQRQLDTINRDIHNFRAQLDRIHKKHAKLKAGRNDVDSALKYLQIGTRYMELAERIGNTIPSLASDILFQYATATDNRNT